ncbi:MAG: hypothetical protein ACFFFG_11910 [Candidatus Thorarchaeota archaeon]
MPDESAKRRPTMKILETMNDYIHEQMDAGNFNLLIPDFAQKPAPDVDYTTAVNLLTIVEYCQTQFPLITMTERSRQEKTKRFVQVQARKAHD